MSVSQDYNQKTADWRGVLRRNHRRTYCVIIAFIAIYFIIGLVVDMFIFTTIYPEATWNQIFTAIFTLKVIPYGTLALGAIGIISLLVTYAFHDKLVLMGTNYREITPDTAADLKEKQLYNVIEEMKVAAGLNFMPRVFLIHAPYMNAFASGYSEKSALVAITTGLLEKLDRDEMQAVMAHELTHIRHMDIKLTLMAAVLSNIMLIVIDFLFYNAIFGGGRGGGKAKNQLMLIIIVIRFLLPVVTALLMLFLSRTREYMADAGAVELMRNNEPLARALLKIRDDHDKYQGLYSELYIRTPHEQIRREAYIFDPIHSGIQPVKSLADVFSSHPGIEKRLKALGFSKKS